MTQFTLPSGGPVHIENPEPAIPARAYCRAKRQFRHVTTTAPATCDACLRASKETDQ